MLSHSTSGVRACILRASTLFSVLLLLALLAIGITALNHFCIPRWQRGEYGADLRLLAGSCRPLQENGESNFVIDLLKSGDFREFLRIHGLTNNHALFVLSHGRSLGANFAGRYAYYPDDRALASDYVPYYSARDLARILGQNAAQIHNVVLAGCNREGAFDAAEVRKYFVNVTNITHTPAGKNGYEFVFRHGLMYASEGIKVLYDMPASFTVGDFSVRAPRYQGKSGLSPYVAELFRPGAGKPWKTQLAGRELFANESPVALAAAKAGPEELSAVLSTAMAAFKPAPPAASGPKPFILVNSQSASSAAQPRAEAPRAQSWLNRVDLGFLGLWRDAILCALIALCLFRISLLCISLAVKDWGCTFNPASIATLLLAVTTLASSVALTSGSLHIMRTVAEARTAQQPATTLAHR